MKRIYLIAVIAAIITAFAVYQFLGSIENKAKDKVEGAINVVVAANKIEENTILQEDMVEIKQISKELVGEGTVQTKEEVVGKIVTYPTLKGEPIYSSRIAPVGAENSKKLSYEIPQGYRAVSMTVDSVSGVSNYIKKGDRVDLVATYVRGESNESKVVFENLLVLRIGTEKESIDKTPYSTVTLAVTPEQAVEMNYTIANAVIRLILRSPLN